MTNTTGVTVVTGTGAKIAGNTGVTLPLSNGAAIEIEVLFNSGGNTANYSVIGNGNPVVPISESSITVGSSPFTYTAPSNCYVTINPITNVSAMNINRSGTPRTIPVSGQVELGLGDKLTVTYSTAPTMFFWPNG